MSGGLAPVVGVGRRLARLGDDGPILRQFGVKFQELFLTGRNLVFGNDGIDRAFRLAQRAIDAFLRIDHEHVRALVEAIHGADFHAVHQFALDAAFQYQEGH